MDNKGRSLRRNNIHVSEWPYVINYLPENPSEDCSVNSFLNILKSFGILEPITKENVNQQFFSDKLPHAHPIYLMEFITPHRCFFKYVFPFLLSLGATISSRACCICNDIYIIPLLECDGIDLGKDWIKKNMCWGRDVFTIIDYGARIPEWSPWEKKTFKTEEIEAYASESYSRTTASRKALAALIICCKQRTHQGTLVFGAVRDVLFLVAREMWAQRGPAGCGPRGIKWSKN